MNRQANKSANEWANEPANESANELTDESASGDCERLHAYVDGELDDAGHAEFEAHLATCDACGAELPRLLSLQAALDGAADIAASSAAPCVPYLTLFTRSRAAGPRAPATSVAEPATMPRGTDRHAAAPRAAESPRTVPVASERVRRRSRSARIRWTAALAGAVAAAAGLLVCFHFFRTGHVWPERPGAPALLSLARELGPTRVLEARLSYPGTEGYRPFDVQRGAGAGEPISSHRLQLDAALERAGNWYGLAVVALLAGERDRAAAWFARAPATPQVDSDRAALELQGGSPAALEHALEHVEHALAAAPDNPAALWNHALVLAALKLPLAAASEFDRVQKLGEPGWAEEAGLRARTLRAEAAQRRIRWKRAYAAGQRLIEDAAPVPAELTQVTGYMTVMLYDAVRAAPSRTAVEALLPLACALDAAYRSDHLTSYVRRIAASDFPARKPLAEAYRALILGPPMTDAATDAATNASIDALLARLARAGADDLRLGALARTGRVASQLAEYRRLATASGDPWFAAIAEQEAAAAEMARGDFAAAEHRLRAAIAAAERERLAYRVLLLRDKLVQLHKAVHHLTQAAEEARVEYHEAIAAGEAVLEMNALADLAAINQNRYANALARAYLSEQLERSRTTDAVGPSPFDEAHDCATRQYAYQSLANLALQVPDPDRARDWLARAPTCSKDFATELMFQRALVAAELYRLAHRDGDARLARKSLAALRPAALSPGEQAMVALIEGTLVLDVDRQASERHLRDAITRADHDTDAANLNAKARAYGFSLLAVSAGRAGDFARVIDLLAEALEVPRPARCAMAIARYDERVVVAFADAGGETGGQYMARRSPADRDARALVPATVVDRLRGCDRVAVLARAPVLGTGRLLPPDLAWSYLLGGPSTGPMSAGARPAATEVRRLVVANPEVPSDLDLPPLGPYPSELAPELTPELAPELAEEPGSAAMVLRGADATPTRVLLAMRDAQVIEFHTHGFIGNDVSEASYLVLSPEVDRQYALTAADVSQVKLEAAPLVILGACYAASSSRSLEGGMGLAEAFLRSGARAVIASPDAIQDLGAPAFFAAVRERVVRGVDPAIALRDERVRRLAGSHDDAWVAGVVVFE